MHVVYRSESELLSHLNQRNVSLFLCFFDTKLMRLSIHLFTVTYQWLHSQLHMLYQYMESGKSFAHRLTHPPTAASSMCK